MADIEDFARAKGLEELFGNRDHFQTQFHFSKTSKQE